MNFTNDLAEILKNQYGLVYKEAISQIQELCLSVLGKDETWGGYDGEEIVNDKEALIRNQLRQSLRKVFKE